MEDQHVAEHRPVLAGEERPDLVLDGDRVRLLGPAQPAGDAPEVGVDRDPRDTEGVAEDDVGGLATDARQLDEVLEAARDLSPVVRDEGLPETDDGARLGAVEAGRSQDLLHLLRHGGGEVGGRRVAREEGRGHLVDPDIGRLSREDRRDEQLQRGLEVELAVRVGVALVEQAVAPAGAALHGKGAVAGLGHRSHTTHTPEKVAWHTVRLWTSK